jgi:hypothetical protein
MNRTTRAILLALAAAALAAVLLLRAERDARAPSTVGVASAPLLPAADQAPPPSRAQSRRLIEPSPPPPPESRPPAGRQGVRGAVASPRVRSPDGTPGIEPSAWECTVYALVPSAERRTVDRIGIVRERVPASRSGDFEVDLPTGDHLVLVQHRIARPGSPPLLEAWYAYATVRDEDRTLVDLGRHEFAAATVAGVVTGPRGEPCGTARIDFTDETRSREDPLTRGVHLVASPGPDGRFEISLARADRQDVVARVSASDGGASARKEGVRPGEFVELVLEGPGPEADATFEIPWSESARVWIYAIDRRWGFARELGAGSAGAIVEERRLLAPGAYVVEIFRSGPAGAEWARSEVVIPDAAPRRIRIAPAYQAARAVTGRARPGSRVAWATRLGDGSTLERGSTTAGEDGRFLLDGLPTTQFLLATGSILTPVPPGCEAVLDVGELKSG